MSLGNKPGHVGRRIVAWGTDGYVRPAEWIALPTLTAGEEKLVGLYRVNNAANQCVAFTCTGNYTVDWDDGSAPENVASGVQAEHTYTFANIDPTTQTPDGWRQAIITITPQAGATLTTINLTSVHSVGTANYTSWWLDVAVVGAGVTQCLCGGTASATLKPVAAMQKYEYVGTNSGTDFSYMFRDCSSLASVPALDTSSGTNFTAMFYGCSSLQTIPALDTSSGTNFTAMFYGCSSLQTIPALDTSSGTNFDSMFRGCGSLQTIPALDTSGGTNFSNMFTSTSKIASSDMFGAKYTHSYATNLLIQSEIVDIFTNLGIAPIGTGQTITVTGNPGAAGLTPAEIAIATAKHWTVVN